MPANWQRLTQFLNGRSEVVHLDWQEFDELVGGVPASAVDHYPQWWHGDRPQTRAWRAAGYEAEQIRHDARRQLRNLGYPRAAQTVPWPL